MLFCDMISKAGHCMVFLLQFFDHPIIEDIVNERWHGDRRVAFRASTLWWLFLNIWCLFDMVLFPLSFFLAFAAGNIFISNAKCRFKGVAKRDMFGDQTFYRLATLIDAVSSCLIKFESHQTFDQRTSPHGLLTRLMGY